MQQGAADRYTVWACTGIDENTSGKEKNFDRHL